MTGAQITAADMGFARALAKTFLRRHVDGRFPLDEAESVALLALVQTAKRYRPEKGAALRTLAFRRINGALMDAWLSLPGNAAERAKGQRAQLCEFDPDEHAVPVDADQEDVVLVGELRRAAKRLRGQRRALVTGVLKGGEQGQVGARLGLSKSWTSRLMDRCIDDLRDAMGVAA